MGWINSFRLHAKKGLSQQEKTLISPFSNKKPFLPLLESYAKLFV